MANWRYDVNLGPESIELRNVDNGLTAQVIHYRTVIDAVAHVKYKYLYGNIPLGPPFTPQAHAFPNQVADISATANDATLSQDNWPDPSDPATLSTSQLSAVLYLDNPLNPSQQWFVRLRYNDGRFLDLPMGKIANQAMRWTNQQEGASKCINDILSNCITP